MSIISKLIQSINQWWNSVFFKRIDGLGLAIFRILFCLVLLYEVGHYIRFHHLVFERIPFVFRGELQAAVLLYTWAFALILLACGWFTRITSIINYLYSVIIFSGASAFEYHIFYSYVGVSFLMVFLPISKRLSIDNLREAIRNQNIPGWKPDYGVSAISYYMPVFMCIGLVYFDSIFFKLATKMWTTGIGMWMPASLPQAVWNDTSWLLNQKELVIFLNYFVIFFEGIFILVMWYKPLRIPIMVIGIIFHIGIYMQYPIPYFAVAYMVMYLLMMPVGYWFKLFQFLGRFLPAYTPIPASHSEQFWPMVKNHFSVPAKQPILSAEVAGSSLPVQLSKFGWKSLFVLSIFFQIVTTWFSPYPRIWRQLNTVVVLNWLTDKAMRPLYNVCLPISKIFLGITHHGVFVDAHFEGFNHIFKAKYVDPSGKIYHVPILTDEGMVDEMVSGITWRNIAFNVITQHVRQDVFEVGIQPYLRQYLVENHSDSLNGHFELYGKRIDVPKEWVKDHLKIQLAKPWSHLGTCKFAGNHLRFSWNDNMKKILAEEKLHPYE